MMHKRALVGIGVRLLFFRFHAPRDVTFPIPDTDENCEGCKCRSWVLRRSEETRIFRLPD